MQLTTSVVVASKSGSHAESLLTRVMLAGRIENHAAGRLPPLVLACALAVLAALAFSAPSAHAFKPNTHSQTADRAWEDVTDDGHITVDGREYPVRAEVVAALAAHRAYFNAGAVGPDGLPDLTYGQAVIHPKQTGKWLRHVLKKAWQAQDDPSYTAAQKSQILAFAYGYLTHAAGDIWAHTLVNDAAEGVFPSVGEILTDLDAAEIAIRHLIVEGYVGDATPGHDGNKERGLVPGELNEDGNPEVSDDASPHIPFAAPKRFIYETFIDPHNPLPVGTCGDGNDDDEDGTVDDGCPGGAAPHGDPEPQRGPLIDFFLDMQADLQIAEARYAWDSEFEDCAMVDPDCRERTKTLTVQTVRGPQVTHIQFNNCEADVWCVLDPGDLASDLTIDNLVETYLEHWIVDIEDGLKNWSDLGLASTKALFDPRSTRQAQDFICRNKPDDENSLVRSNCEDGVGMLEVIGYESEDFFNDHMLSMLGAPDVVGDLNALFSEISNTLSDVFGPALNPLDAVEEVIKDFAKAKIEEAIEDATHLDLDQIKSFVTSPTHWLGVQSVSLNLPGIGTQQIDLFQPDTHEKLDALMHLPPDHHEDQQVKLPGVGTVPSTGLTDDAEFDPENFAAYRNTVQTAKLLLLDGAALNDALGDILEARGDIKTPDGVSTYAEGGAVPANVMVDQLGGSEPWLRSIDSDHSWRSDGRPRFCAEEGPDCPDSSGAQPRPEKLDAGNDTFPLWESCLLRPTFAMIYRDWENGAAQFPALGDLPSSDPSDPDAPDATLELAGNTFTDNGVTYVGANHEFTTLAEDDVFADARIATQYRFSKENEAPGPWLDIAPGGTFSIPVGAGDGTYKVQMRTADPCHTFDPTDALPAGSPVMREVVLDTTPPEIEITKPAPDGVLLDSDDFSSIEYAVTDTGSAVDHSTVSATFDGTSATNGQVLDMFLLAPGTHTIEVAAADNLGNATDKTRTFELHATSESLGNNIDRSCTEKLITKSGTCKSLSITLEHAAGQHDIDRHAVEHNDVNAFIQQVEAQLGKSIDTATGNRLIAFAEDLIATNG